MGGSIAKIQKNLAQ